MKIGLWKKGLVLGIILLFVGAGVIPSTGAIAEKITTMYAKSGSYIQDLIDNASDGDTIKIPSGFYYENIVIDKSIYLEGEDKDTTIIDGGGNGTVIYISDKGVTVSDFTIQNGSNGIKLLSSKFNTISGNTISNNYCGIRFKGNSRFNTVKGNNILNNNQGIYLEDGATINNIVKNNFIDNYRDAFFQNSRTNRWRQNYWNKSRIIPKLIHGEICFSLGSFGLVIGGISRFISIPWIPQIDWRPAKEPYDI